MYWLHCLKDYYKQGLIGERPFYQTEISGTYSQIGKEGLVFAFVT